MNGETRFIALDRRGHVHKTLVYPAILSEFVGDTSAGHTLFNDYNSHCAAFALPFAGTTTTLLEVRALGLSIGIVTNGETEFQSKHIEVLGLRSLVDLVLISQCEGIRKPDPAIFCLAAERLRVSTSQCLFVGDNPVADILGAAATGMETAWLRGSMDWPIDQPPNLGATLDCLEEVLHLLVPGSRLSGLHISSHSPIGPSRQRRRSRN